MIEYKKSKQKICIFGLFGGTQVMMQCHIAPLFKVLNNPTIALKINTDVLYRFLLQKLTHAWDGENATKCVWLQCCTPWQNTYKIQVAVANRSGLVLYTLGSYSRFSKPRIPMPLKSVLGSSPWKPIFCHCLVFRVISGIPGWSKLHNWSKLCSCSKLSAL